MKYSFKSKPLAIFMSVFDFFGRLLFKFTLRQKSVIKKPARVLVIRLDHLGDIWFAGAIPKLVKENLGVTHVTFLTSSTGGALLENNPFVDQALIYDAPWFLRSKKNSAGANYWQTIRRLKETNFDLSLCLRGDLRENLLAFLACSRKRVGYGITGGGFFLTRELPYCRQAHEREHSLDILRFIGIEEPALEPKAYFTEAEEKLFALKFKQWGLEDSAAIGVQVGAGASAKEWPEENVRRFLALGAQKLGSRKLVFVGTDAQRFSWIDPFIKDHPAPGWANLIGKTNLRELLYCMRHFSAFIGPDSGPTHVAVSFGMPTLFLYSGTNEFEHWKSLGENADFLRNPVPCSPCHELQCPVAGHPCMTGIEPERVIDWLLERSRERR